MQCHPPCSSDATHLQVLDILKHIADSGLFFIPLHIFHVPFFFKNGVQRDFSMCKALKYSNNSSTTDQKNKQESANVPFLDA